MSKTKIPVFVRQIFLPFLPRDFFVLQYSEKKKAFKRHSQMLLPLLLHFPLSSYHFILNPYKMSLEIRCLLCACLCAAHAGSLWVLFCGIFGNFFVHVRVYATYFGTWRKTCTWPPFYNTFSTKNISTLDQHKSAHDFRCTIKIIIKRDFSLSTPVMIALTVVKMNNCNFERNHF